MNALRDLAVLDGHNLVFALDRYRGQTDTPVDSAVEKLVRDTINISAQNEIDVALIFDGRGAGSKSEPADGVRVIYSSERRSADELIERLVFSESAARQIKVYTADRAQQKVVWRPGVRKMSPRDWESLIEESAEEAESDRGARKSETISDRLSEDLKQSLKEIGQEEDQ